MKRKMGALAVLALAAGMLGAADKTADLPKPDADGFVSLFNGTDLTNWDGLDGFWSVKDGCISGHETKDGSKQTFLILTAMQPPDFELHFSYKFATPDGNSGVQFRSQVIDPKTDRVGGYQADFDAKGGYDGSIYDEAGVAGGRGTMSNRGERTVWDADNNRSNEKLHAAGDDLKKFINVGDWNDCVVVAKGRHITYAINGHLTTQLIDDSPKALKDGVIALQLHAGFTMEILFKDVKIKLLDSPK
jgi:3-keto-disaccharide hydrolase